MNTNTTKMEHYQWIECLSFRWITLPIPFFRAFCTPIMQLNAIESIMRYSIHSIHSYINIHTYKSCNTLIHSFNTFIYSCTLQCSSSYILRLFFIYSNASLLWHTIALVFYWFTIVPSCSSLVFLFFVLSFYITTVFALCETSFETHLSVRGDFLSLVEWEMVICISGRVWNDMECSFFRTYKVDSKTGNLCTSSEIGTT